MESTQIFNTLQCIHVCNVLYVYVQEDIRSMFVAQKHYTSHNLKQSKSKFIHFILFQLILLLFIVSDVVLFLKGIV